jgi:hypothetical protein
MLCRRFRNTIAGSDTLATLRPPGVNQKPPAAE